MAARDENDKWDDVWRALGVVVVAGVVVTGFILVGVWIARRRENEQRALAGGIGGNGLGMGLAGLGLGLGTGVVLGRVSPGSMGGLVESPSGMLIPAAAERKPVVPFRNTTYRYSLVRQRAVKILGPSVHPQLRRVWVTADAPIRVADSQSVDASFIGTPIQANSREDMGVFGPEQELYAVQAGPIGAKVNVEIQFIGAAIGVG